MEFVISNFEEVVASGVRDGFDKDSFTALINAAIDQALAGDFETKRVLYKGAIAPIVVRESYSKEAIEFADKYSNLCNTSSMCVATWAEIDSFFCNIFGEDCQEYDIEVLYDSLSDEDKAEVSKMIA